MNDRNTSSSTRSIDRSEPHGPPNLRGRGSPAWNKARRKQKWQRTPCRERQGPGRNVVIRSEFSKGDNRMPQFCSHSAKNAVNGVAADFLGRGQVSGFGRIVLAAAFLAGLGVVAVHAQAVLGDPKDAPKIFAANCSACHK